MAVTLLDSVIPLLDGSETESTAAAANKDALLSFLNILSEIEQVRGSCDIERHDLLVGLGQRLQLRPITEPMSHLNLLLVVFSCFRVPHSNEPALYTEVSLPFIIR